MDTILVAITGLSLALAAGMGVMLVRTLRFERRRSDARVALLEELAARPEARINTAPPAPPTVPLSQSQRVRVESGVRTSLRTGSLDDLELRPGIPGAAASDPRIFDSHDGTSAWPRRLAVIGVITAVLCVISLGWRALASRDTVPSPTTQSAAQTQTPALSGKAGVAQPLELLSLQHAQQDGTLLISGLVQNPRGSSPLQGVQATVVLLAADSATLASSRAPLDFTTLAPGDESPFVIRMPATASVARYRVGFRGGDDRILGHVDRRNHEIVARKQAP